MDDGFAVRMMSSGSIKQHLESIYIIGGGTLVTWNLLEAPNPQGYVYLSKDQSRFISYRVRLLTQGQTLPSSLPAPMAVLNARPHVFAPRSAAELNLSLTRSSTRCDPNRSSPPNHFSPILPSRFYTRISRHRLCLTLIADT